MGSTAWEVGAVDDWRERAACRGKPTALFFAADPTAAQEVCAGCGVSRECLADALRSEDPHGVRGGLTGLSRARLIGNRQLVRLAMESMAMAIPEEDRCRQCGAPFKRHHGLQQHCSMACASAHRHRRTNDP